VRLVLFDVDGTLLDNRGAGDVGGVDDECFARAFRREFGVEKIEMDWARYPHATDSAITKVVLADHFGRPATDDEIRRSREGYVAELRARADAGEVVAAPMRGAAESLAALASRGWTAALATGGWRASALFKMERSGLSTAAWPGAFADDHESREGITTIARRRAESAENRAATRVVYVGDAVWDVRACASLGMAFVGVGARAERLRRAGATIVIEDFADEFFAALDAASPPR